MEWLQGKVGQVGRFQNYKNTLSKVFRRVLENRQRSIPEEISPAEYVETRFEANALINVWKQFRSDTSRLLAEKLAIIVRGAQLTSSEGKKTEPRDILFELETAALLKDWLLPVQLGHSADLRFEFNGVPVLCECKRPQTPKAFAKNLKIANSQLRDALAEPHCPANAIGLIAIDISRVVHLDLQGLERYQPTKYGNFELPSNMVGVLNQVQFGQVVEERVLSFLDLHREAFLHQFSLRVGGYMVCYNIPAVDLNGTGRTWVLGYQNIGGLKPSTSGESQFFRDFHTAMLPRFRY